MSSILWHYIVDQIMFLRVCDYFPRNILIKSIDFVNRLINMLQIVKTVALCVHDCYGMLFRCLVVQKKLADILKHTSRLKLNQQTCWWKKQTATIWLRLYNITLFWFLRAWLKRHKTLSCVSLCLLDSYSLFPIEHVCINNSCILSTEWNKNWSRTKNYQEQYCSSFWLSDSDWLFLFILNKYVILLLHLY